MFRLGSEDKLPESIKGLKYKFTDATYVNSNHRQPIAFVKIRNLLETAVV